MSADRLDQTEAIKNSPARALEILSDRRNRPDCFGVIAVCVPPLATVTVEILIGWLILLSGVLGLVMTFQTRGSPGFAWSLLSAIVGIPVGIVLLIWPLSGVFSLTVMLTIFSRSKGSSPSCTPWPTGAKNPLAGK